MQYVADQCGVRIIPARAGFTSRRSHRTARTGDHPRSRGVYTALRAEEDPAPGSSPLARGLRRGLTPSGLSGRIIPARAGFTLGRGTRTTRTADHPRSRGVYVPGLLQEALARGSSPLARGLRAGRRPHLLDQRIIPARAGFTEPAVGGAAHSEDHPRSRGVYAACPCCTRSRPGSSPLARGLHGGLAHRDPAGGIIPARAGFTRPASGPRRPSPDHPRSRGVYVGGGATVRAAGGSSPLARGLPALAGGGDAADGIIPARAGFTHLLVAGPLPGEDHPRSRGVYAQWGKSINISEGSSPLARGLRAVGITVAVPVGIIPARAGFTHWRHSEDDR